MRRTKVLKSGLILALSVLFNFPVFAQPQHAPADSIVHLTLLHFNDIYEITPLAGGAQGGLARVATLRRQLMEENPNTFTVLAGDLFSPSALGTATVDGDRLAGRQMVAVLNALGLDYCTFGNHEFDLREKQFYQRLNESRFHWLSSNVFAANGQPFPGVADSVILTVSQTAGPTATVGWFGVTLPSNRQPYATYTDPLETAARVVHNLRDKVDILIAITHLPLEDDIKLADRCPDIDLILGGHEHENVQVWRGADLTPICKADANVRTVYIHRLSYNTSTRRLQIHSELQAVTGAIAEDPQVQREAQHWVDVAYAGFQQMGFDPQRAVAELPVALDGLESSVRNRSTKLTELIAAAMLNAATGTELAVFNGGSIRIDDVLLPGNITEYDVIRILPFGGSVLSVEMKGALLARVLDQGVANKGTGGFLQTAKVGWDQERKGWLIAGQALDAGKSYQVAINDFLVSGKEVGLTFLNREHGDLRVIKENMDVRRALIEELARSYGKQ